MCPGSRQPLAAGRREAERAAEGGHQRHDGGRAEAAAACSGARYVTDVASNRGIGFWFTQGCRGA